MDFCFADAVPGIIINDHFTPQQFEIAPRSPFVFYKKYLAVLHGIQYIRWNGFSNAFIQVAGYQVYSCQGDGWLFVCDSGKQFYHLSF
jgi:hypothetical protein